MQTIATYLRNHALTELFIDLGWDRAKGEMALTAEGRTLSFSQCAQKRGLQVVRCPAERAVLSDRALLRKFQKLLARTFHEHILIFTSEEPRKQVWQWSIRLPDGRKVRHREHPFFSDKVPPALLARLGELRFSLEVEEGVSLVDALGRVRRVLDTTAEQQLFARRPRLAQRSDELARAVQRGDPGAMHRFVLFHRPLALKMCKRLRHWFDLPEEDAEQIGFLGLIDAARRFKPELGFQFSTYACLWIKQYCQRLGPAAALLVHVPVNMFWTCFRLGHDIERIEAAGGRVAVNEYLAAMEVTDPWTAGRLRACDRARNVATLSQREHMREAARIRDGTPPPIDRFLRADWCDELRRSLRLLKPRDAEVIRRRYGLDGEAETLDQIGQSMGLTRERIRQIEERAEAKLRRALGPAAIPPDGEEGDPTET